MSNFDICFALVFDIEKGYVDDPRDPGGPTKYGISSRAYPDLDIKNLTPEKAREIYLSDYWNLTNCDFIPGPIALLVFDGAVNHGRDAMSKILQKCLGVNVDGVVGKQTLRACQNHPDLVSLIIEIASHRALRYAHGDIKTMGLGWYRRLMLMTSISLEGLI